MVEGAAVVHNEVQFPSDLFAPCRLTSGSNGVTTGQSMATRMGSSSDERLDGGDLRPLLSSPTGELDDQAIASFLDVMLDVFVETLRADRASILLFDPQSQRLSIEAALGIPEQVVRTTQIACGEGIVGLSVQEQVPMVLRGRERPEYLNVPLNRPDVVASFVIPIYHEGHSMGAICASSSKSADLFSRRNLDWMIEVSNRLSPVLLALQEQKKHRQTIGQLSRLVEAIDRLAQLDEGQEAIELTLKTTGELCGTKSCFYVPVLSDSREFYLSTRRQLIDAQWSPVEVQYFEHLGREVLEHQEEIDVAPQHRASFLVRQALAERNIERVSILPVQTPGELHGLLYSFPRRYTRTAVRLLRLLASHLAAFLSREAHFKQLENWAFVDELTHTYNRNYWMERFREELSRAERMQTPLSIIMFDIDDFKSCNDRYGHSVGDRVLASVARLIQRSARNFDNVCRYGGEEFMILLPEVDRERAWGIAERIRRNIEQSPPAEREGEGPGQLTVSGGIATLSRECATLEALLEAADQAMYEAKRLGKNRVCLATRPVDKQRESGEVSLHSQGEG